MSLLQLPNKLRPCAEQHPEPAKTASECRLCELYETNQRYRTLWGGEPLKVSAVDTKYKITKVDTSTLPPSQQGAYFNASIIRFKGKLLLAYRTGWKDAQCSIAELDENYSPRRNVVLYGLKCPAAAWGREDPRLFIFRGKLHIAYIGVLTGSGPTNQLYARLNDDLTVSEVFVPNYQYRTPWEKNWSMFEWEGELFAVYQTGPKHAIIHINGNRAYPFTETPNTFPWSGGKLSGGAPPIRVGNYFYHWFHGRLGAWSYGVYTVGVNIFEAKPPFKVVAQTANPLVTGDKGWRLPYQSENFPAAVFPSGAILENGKWIVSNGVQDHWIEIHEWDAKDIESILRRSPRGECEHLGKRTEFKVGCSGWKCKHECTAGEPFAEPGGVCQLCPKWSPAD